jgi:hypothetical protein
LGWIFEVVKGIVRGSGEEWAKGLLKTRVYYIQALSLVIRFMAE